MDNIVISFDESTTSTGYAIFINGELKDYGAFIEKSKNVLERVSNIMNNIRDLIEYYSPTDVAIENVQITMSAPTARSLMGLQFMIELLCYQNNIPYTLIRPSSWRKSLGLSNSPKLKRVDKKKETIEYIKNKYGIDEKIDDICDAIAIGESYIKENNNKG